MRTLLMTLLVGFVINVVLVLSMEYVGVALFGMKAYTSWYVEVNANETVVKPIMLLVWFLVWVFFVWANFRKEALNNKRIED